MKKFIGLFTSFMFLGTGIFCLKLVLRNYIKNNPADVIALIFKLIEFLTILAINTIEWILKLLL